MNANLLENTIECKNSFTLNAALNELTVNGVVKFQKDKSNTLHPYWNNRRLTIPVYGVYKISWGFHQNSIGTFYKDSKTELGLVINNSIYTDKAKITKETSSFHAVKASHKTLTLLLRENDTIALNAEVFNAEILNMRDLYLNVYKLNVD